METLCGTTNFFVTSLDPSFLDWLFIAYLLFGRALCRVLELCVMLQFSFPGLSVHPLDFGPPPAMSQMAAGTMGHRSSPVPWDSQGSLWKSSSLWVAKSWWDIKTHRLTVCPLLSPGTLGQSGLTMGKSVTLWVAPGWWDISTQ